MNPMNQEHKEHKEKSDPRKNRPRRTIKKTDRDYIDNTRLGKLMTEWNAAGGCVSVIPIELYLMVDLLSKRVIKMPSFYRYTEEWKEEMIGNGLDGVFRYAGKNWDSKKISKRDGKPVSAIAYLTTIMYYAYVQVIKVRKRQESLKYRAFVESGSYANHIEADGCEFDMDMQEKAKEPAFVKHATVFKAIDVMPIQPTPEDYACLDIEGIKLAGYQYAFDQKEQSSSARREYVMMKRMEKLDELTDEDIIAICL